MSRQIDALFLDIGGVLLTNGWDRVARAKAAKRFSLNLKELNDLHREIFDTYELGKASLEEYLQRVVFYQKRKFTSKEFRTFMLEQSKPYPKMIALMRALKARYGLKIVALSNEGRELNTHRIHQFHLNQLIDFFVSSSYVHLKKPDTAIYKIALDVSQVSAKRVLYIEDRPMFVQVAQEMGINAICHTNYDDTVAELKRFNLSI